MLRRSLLVIALLCSFCALLPAQASSASLKDISEWPEGVVQIDDGWRMHAGDNPAWAQPGFDDSSWPPVSLPTQPGTGAGFIWHRLHLRFPASRPAMALLVMAPENACEVYVNGRLAGDTNIRSPLLQYRLAWLLVPLPDGVADVELAVRIVQVPYSLQTRIHNAFPAAMIGPAPVARYAADRDHYANWASFLPGAAVDLVVVFGGLAVLALYFAQRSLEYLWLSIYLLLMGSSDLVYIGGRHAVLPWLLNAVFGDPAVFAFLLFQIQFTFTFARQRVSPGWRAYQAILAAMFPVGVLCNILGLFPTAYIGVEALLQAITSIALPVLLLLWFRRGNREAAWLILPSFLSMPGALTDLLDFSPALRQTYAGLFNRLLNIPVGPVSVRTQSAMNFLYVVAIGIVLFFRHTRVTQAESRAAAELDAAREIQSRLVPLELPEIEGCRISAAYFPATEVGGDFFQVLQQPDGSTLIAVGDVSGKGLRAAMTGTLVIGALRTLADQAITPPRLLAGLNRQLAHANHGGFVTMLCARLAPDGTLALANAGHLHPYRNGEEVQVEDGLPLGIVAEPEYQETILRLEPGDSITFLSDGVVEARSASGELFGFDRARTASTQSPQAIAEAARCFGQEDDITVLSLSFAPVRQIA